MFISHSQLVEEQIDVIVKEKVPVVVTGAGNPTLYIADLKQAGTKVMPVVANVEQAQKMEAIGADVIVAEGMEAGGHVGRVTTLSLVPQIVDAVIFRL